MPQSRTPVMTSAACAKDALDRSVQEPRLVALLVELLHAHGEWFRLQRCKDRFLGALGIDALHSTEPPGPGALPAS